MIYNIINKKYLIKFVLFITVKIQIIQIIVVKQ